MAITRKELSEILGEKSLFSASKCAEFVDMVFETMAETLERGEKIKIAGFGNFFLRDKRARIGRNPQTGEKMEIAARRVVTFNPSLLLRKALNPKTTRQRKLCRPDDAGDNFLIQQFTRMGIPGDIAS